MSGSSWADRQCDLKEGIYYIRNSSLDCYAGILRNGSDNALRGVSNDPKKYYMKWRVVDSVDWGTRKVYSITEADSGFNLGLDDSDLRQNKPEAVQRSRYSGIWYFSKTDTGYMIFDGRDKVWNLDKRGEPIILSDKDIFGEGAFNRNAIRRRALEKYPKPQSWQFVPANEIPSIIDYPTTGVYYIQNLSKLDCYAGVRKDDCALRGVANDPEQYSVKWRVIYLHPSEDDPDWHAHRIIDVNEVCGLGMGGGVGQNPTVLPEHHLGLWFIRKTGTGHIISPFHDDKYTLYLGNKDELIVVSDEADPQSWRFVQAE
ncbi:uncharacterized protein EDB91DRAFT_1272638 [Suillus paluster]|uniref:uncharacterized protein n=1 Tax=Suillus paluster TaxID=48578 RepID=UPI001B86C289|nr:uncharacterized protein EDB91DRAFT_1272638 [Suillus paluster]KAG1744592.1 hypothetical protein EDB91DRAFT_1272638 [Suillus paluster]